MAVWPPLALNELALGYIYNCAYDAAILDDKDDNGAPDAHQAACEAVHREGFMQATNGQPPKVRQAVAELRAAVFQILSELPEGRRSATGALVQAKRERLQTALDRLEAAMGPTWPRKGTPE